MLPNPWILVGVLVAAIALAIGSFTAGRKFEKDERAAADLVKADKIITVVQKVKEIEVQTVTKYLTKTKTIEVKAEEIKNEIPILVKSDCVLPPEFIVQLHAISRNTTVSALGLTEDAGKGAGCRSALDALSQSYANHYADAAQLNAILERESELEHLNQKGATP